MRLKKVQTHYRTYGKNLRPCCLQYKKGTGHIAFCTNPIIQQNCTVPNCLSVNVLLLLQLPLILPPALLLASYTEILYLASKY